MDHYVLDTNLFFNMEPGLNMGKKTEDVVMKVTKSVKKLVDDKKGKVFMPPSIVKEFLSFFDDKEQPFIKDFLTVVTIKTPDITKVDFSASVFYKLVADIRERSYRGLTLSEEELKRALYEHAGHSFESKQDFEKISGKHVKTLRNRYRQATRVGFLDSVEDLDLITLAKE